MTGSFRRLTGFPSLDGFFPSLAKFFPSLDGFFPSHVEIKFKNFTSEKREKSMFLN
ncbi:hypothetical protein [Lysinibacillus sp. TE18511]